MATALTRLFAEGKLKAIVSQSYPLSAAQQALADLLNRTLQDSYTCSTVPAFSSVRHAHGKRRAERQTCAHSQGLSIAPLAGVPHSCRSGLPFLSWDVSVLAWQAAAAQSGYVYMLAEHE